MNNLGKRKIPYDATPISREGASFSRQTPAKSKLSLNIFISAIFIFNIVISSLFIYYIFNNKKDNTVNMYNQITTSDSAVAVASGKAKLSSVCIGVGGQNNEGEKFSSTLVPSYSEILTNTTSRGAGVILDVNKSTGEAYILTCNHVLGGNTDPVFVLLYDSYKSVVATIVGRSIVHDLAVVKIKDDEAKGACQKATIADSSIITEGDDAIAVGNPQHNGFAVTSGHISRTSVLVNTAGQIIRTIQVDTAVNKGNSGGGLYDKNGNLIGIVESKSDSAGIDNVAFAIHSNFAVSVANNLIGGRMLQYAESGFSLAIGGADIEIIDGKVYKFEKVFVASVVAGTDASNAGLVSGDQIVAVRHNGITKQVTSTYFYEEIKYDLSIGDVVEYTVIRGGQALDKPIKVTITKLVGF